MHDWQYNNLKPNDILHMDQYGFHAGHSSNLAPLRILDIIMKAWENRQVIISVMMDLSETFNTLDHSILSDKLQAKCIQNSLFNWLKLYMTSHLRQLIYEVRNPKLPILDAESHRVSSWDHCCFSYLYKILAVITAILINNNNYCTLVIALILCQPVILNQL